MSLTKPRARLAEVIIDGMTMWVEYNPIKADPENCIAAGVEIETVCAGGEEISNFIETNCTEVWGKIEAAILAKISNE